MAVYSFAAVYRGYRQCRRRKRGTANAQRYEHRLLDHLVDTTQALQNRTYAPSRFLCFVARQPKAREIHAADFSGRVVHHVLVPRLGALFEPVFIHDLYSNRVGKGTHAAVERLAAFMRAVSAPGPGPGWFLQLALKPDSIPRPVTDGADFLGYIVRPHYRLVRRRVVGNLRAKLAAFARDQVTATGLRLPPPPSGSNCASCVIFSPGRHRLSPGDHWSHHRHPTAARRTMRHHKKIGWALALAGLMGTALAQTCRDDIKATAPDSRFSDNGNGTVTDLATGLIWKQCAEGLSGAGCATGGLAAFTWLQALQQAESAVFAGSSLWRLPNKNELASLIERRCYDPAINTRFFPNTPSNWFGSSSPNANDADDADGAWGVYFYSGYVGSYGKDYAVYVRLVRGGQ